MSEYKSCPFRSQHFCNFCELLDKNTGQCILKLINWNLGIIAKVAMGDPKTARKILNENLEVERGTTKSEKDTKSDS